MAQHHLTHPTTATKVGIALGILAAALIALVGHTTTGTTEASNRETGTVKTEASAGDKKVEVIKA
ncbi:hypothetical protein [Streptomyces sp. NBC_00572]|uniref:hypothetical protein n=1 Tax=Streptomyces sp. NBC_00572 TaxID=2903664 RepID=UPI0022549579|nr:hypothetical protein [Streptomyces sp. NBC_00572]MCX4980655.1 hypothetical protein [Streptomyces sp. NBC_00572]